MENLAIVIFTVFMSATIISILLFIVGLIKKDFKFKPKKRIIGICIVGFFVSVFFYGAVETPETKAGIEAKNKIEEEQKAIEKAKKEEKEALEKADKEALKLKEEEDKLAKEKAKEEENKAKEKDKADKEALYKKEQEELENKKKEDLAKKEESNKNEISESKIELKLRHGKLLSTIINDDKVVIKAKIEPSYNNKATISQNGFNIEDIIKNQGGYRFKEIQYWAVADMSDGEESKVISFTINEEMIKNIKNGNIVGNQIVDKSMDVWILPSLQK